MNQPQYPIELVVLDLDGTVLNPLRNVAISPAVSSAISAVQQKGVKLTIGTGRTLDLMRPYAEALNVSLPVITTQGAIVADPGSGEIFAQTLMPLEAAIQVANWVDSTRRTTVFYFPESDGSVRVMQNNMDGDSSFYDHVFGLIREHQPTFAALLSGAGAAPPVKFITINDMANEADIALDLTERFPALTITRTHPMLVEGTASGINKGAGLRKLCELLQVDPKNVMAIGDNDNDIPMLEAAGFAVAMGNGSAGTKAVADWVAPTIEEDGAAVALHQWVLKG